VSDSRILATAMYFFIWQIPHFWLLLMIYGDDYEKAGFPTLRSLFTDEQLRRITFMWLVANTITALSLLMFIKLNYELSFYVLLLNVFWMIYVSVNFFRLDLTNYEIRKTFISLNFFTLILVTTISLDKLISLL
ncbi:MAG: hypothetical protein N2510_01830, partial [Ignavibacteria bacterium]|nr:hypothetical protein [Ignavibacteria bacterium]